MTYDASGYLMECHSCLDTEMLPLLISTLSLAVSVASFLFSNLREKHHLQLVIDHDPQPTGTGLLNEKQQIKLSVSLLNKGNRSETVLQTLIIFENGDFKAPSQGPAALVLKPGEASTMELLYPLVSATSLWAVSADNPLEMGVLLRCIEPHGRILMRTFSAGQISFRGGSLQHFPNKNGDAHDVIKNDSLTAWISS